MISFSLSDEQTLVKETVRKFAAEVVRPGARGWERRGCIPAEAERAFFALGLSLIDVEEESHGQGMGLLTAALVHEELAAGDAAAALALFSPHSVPHALATLGSREQRQRLLGPFAEAGGESVPRGAIAFSERWKSRAVGFATTATPVDGGYLLSGVKSYVVNAGSADLTIVFAQVDASAGWDGVGVFAVTGRAGDERTLRLGNRHELLGLSEVAIAELLFDGHFVPEENRLRGGGDVLAAAQAFFARCQLTNAARQVGLCRAAYEYALEYTQERKAFGKPVAHFQAIAFTLAEMLMDLDSARWMVWHAAAAMDRGAPSARLCAEAALHANQAAWRIADSCVQLLGGAGYIMDYPAEKWLRDTRVLSLIGGTDEIYRQHIAVEELGHTLEGHAGASQGILDARLPLLGLHSSVLQPIIT